MTQPVEQPQWEDMRAVGAYVADRLRAMEYTAGEVYEAAHRALTAANTAREEAERAFERRAPALRAMAALLGVEVGGGPLDPGVSSFDLPERLLVAVKDALATERTAKEEAERRERDTAASNRLSSDMFEMVRADLAAFEARAVALEGYKALATDFVQLVKNLGVVQIGAWPPMSELIARYDALSTPATDDAQEL